MGAKAWHRTNEASRRLEAIPGVGVITATALVATIGDASQFHSGRQLAAWLGLVPRQYSSGGKARLGRISKRGDGYLRRLLVHGARADLRWSRHRKERRSVWQESLLARRPTNVVLVAMANKTARVVWAMLRRRSVRSWRRPGRVRVRSGVGSRCALRPARKAAGQGIGGDADGGEPTIADAVLDRIVHNAYRIDLKGKSERKRNKPRPLDGGDKGPPA